MTEKENTIKWISLLRVLATIAVIVVHVSMESRYGNALYADLIYGGLARFCVPVFVMISGVLLIPREIELFSFTKKWMLKIIVPFIFWNIPYLIYNIELRLNSGEALNLKTSLFESFKCMYKDSTSYHFWYIYMIMGIYLFIPIIGKWARLASQKEHLYFLVIWFGLLILQVPSLNKYKPAIDLYYFSGYIGYLVLGYYLNTFVLNYKIWLPVLLLALGYFLTSALTYYYTSRDTHFVHTYYDYLRPNIVILSSGVFLLIKRLNNIELRVSFLSKFWRLLEKHSYGIYLIHLLVLLQLKKYDIDYRVIHPLIGIPLCTLLSLLISFLLVWTVNKLPFLGKYISG